MKKIIIIMLVCSFVISCSDNPVIKDPDPDIIHDWENISSESMQPYLAEICGDNNFIYLALSDELYNGYFYISHDNGVTWTYTNYSLATDSMRIRDICVIDDNIYILSTNNSSYVWYSNENGNSWNSWIPYEHPSGSISYKNGTIILGTNSNGIVVSSDSGYNWRQSNIESMNIHEQNSNNSYVFASAMTLNYPYIYHGILTTASDGIYWEQTGLGAKDVYRIAVYNSTIHAICYEGLYLSEDNGNNWLQISTGSRMLVDGAASGYKIFILSNADTNINVSNDRGLTWKNESNNIKFGERIIINNGYVFIWTRYNKLFRRKLDTF